LKDFAEEVLKLTGSSVKTGIYKDLPGDDPKNKENQILLKQKNYWVGEPKVDRAEGLKKPTSISNLPKEEWSKQPKEFTSK
jgi:dTDP-glucose 4,6-dehydratase